MFLVQVDPQVRRLLEDLHAQYSQTGVCGYLPGVFLRVVVHHRPQHHQLDAAALQQGHLVLLAQLRETGGTHLVTRGTVGCVGCINSHKYSGYLPFLSGVYILSNLCVL